MRPLFHPSIDELTVESILYALSDPARAAIFAQIAGSNCPRICSNFLDLGSRGIPKSTLSQHFKVLREAGLIRSERRGVELHNISRCQEIDQRFPGLLAAITDALIAQAKQEPSGNKTRKPATGKSGGGRGQRLGRA